MAKNTLVLAARGIVQDVRSNAVSAYNLLESFAVQSLPVLIPEVGVLSVWLREKGDKIEVPVKFTLRNNDEIVIEHDIDITFSEGPSSRIILNIAPLLVKESGLLVFTFTIDGKKVGEYIVPVINVESNIHSDIVPSNILQKNFTKQSPSKGKHRK